MLRYDREERDFVRSVPPLGRLQQDRLPPGRPLVYGRETRDARGRVWLQYWLYFAANTQDRGLVRTGRHEGDWELMQIRLDGRRPVAVTFAQHSWAEGCAWDEIERAGPAPVAYVANGSHALYPTAGEADRPFPDPDDEADGEGRTARPPVSRIDDRSPRWMAWPGRWGGTEAGFVPGEESSPRGPAFQPERWVDPGRFHDEYAHPCGSGPPGRAWQTILTLALAALAAAILLRLAARRLRRTYNREP